MDLHPKTSQSGGATWAVALLTLGLSVGSLGSCTPTAKPVASKPPNILLIVADDLGYSDIGSYGGEISTPALDQLAKEGVQLSNFHVLPTCSPTRSVLLSGMDNHRAGLGTMGEFVTPEMEGIPGYAGYLNFEVAALPEVMRRAGYHTYVAGKWHLGEEENTSPHARGFEETFVLLQGGGSHWSDRKPICPPEAMVYQRNGKEVDSLPENFYSSRYYTDRILEWIERGRNDDKPFFAYLSYTAPHDPLHAPNEYIAKYKGKYDQGWDSLRQERLEGLKKLGMVPNDAVPFPRLPNVKAWDELPPEEQALAARDMEVYAAMVDYMDEQIQRVFDYLKEIGEYDNTMILFMSDNGANGALPTAYPGQTEEYLGSFDNSLDNRGLPGSYIEMGPGWAQASMSPSRMFKAYPTEGGIKAPFLVKVAGKPAKPGSVNHSFVHVRDIMPTLLDVAGAAKPEVIDGREVLPMQGQSVLDLFAGKSDKAYAGASRVGYELFSFKAFIDENWKIVRMPKPLGTGEWELFDLSKDPAEIHDLSAEQPDKLAEMVTLWEQYKEENGVLDIVPELAK
jgi:arylsulfatase